MKRVRVGVRAATPLTRRGWHKSGPRGGPPKPTTAEGRVVYTPAPNSADPRPERVTSSDDGRYLFFKSHDAEGRASIWSVPVAGGRPRLLVRFSDLSRPSIRPDFTSGAGRFFFTLEDRQSDIWIAEIARPRP